MDVLKYFHEEPAVLGAATPDAEAEGAVPLSRGYLAGTHLPDGPDDALRVGLTALADPALWQAPLFDLWGAFVWTRVVSDGTPTSVVPADALADPAASPALVVAPHPFTTPLPTDLLGDGRTRAAAAVALLAAGAHAVVWPEPAHDGHDLTILAAGPLHAPLAAALARHPAPAARRFLVPFRRARGEHLFYFEQWQLDALPPHVEEV
ncbi:MAG TPA: hypothetical protein VK610_10975 [Rhodothermales bacterium]|nr:hypothetical protein [Rhodothermales bacterium]